MLLDQHAVAFLDTVGTAAPPPATVAVGDSGGRTLSELTVGDVEYDAAGSDWLVATLNQATTPAALTLAADSGMPVGTYTATVHIVSDSAANSPQTVAVTLTMEPSPNVLVVNQGAIAFSHTIGTTAPPPVSVTVTDSVGGTIDGLTVGDITWEGNASGWVEATLNQATTPATVTLTTRDNGTAAGTFRAMIPIVSAAAANSPQIAVTMAVSPPPGSSITIAATGNFGACNTEAARATADAIASINPDYVFFMGDMATPGGGRTHNALEDYQTCFDPAFGRFKDISFVALGEKDVDGNPQSPTAGTAAGADAYFGAAHVGPPGQNYWSFELGSWHIVALNVQSGGPLRPAPIRYNAGSAQLNWLWDDLEAHPAQCTLAFWHDPMWMSGSNAPTPTDPNPNHNYRNQPIRGVWTVLYERNADLVLNAGMHIYERFAPMRYAEGYWNPTPSEFAADPVRGVRQITNGLAGNGPLATPSATVRHPLSEYRSGGNGVVKITLWQGMYSWEFVNTRYSQIQDSGSGRCH